MGQRRGNETAYPNFLNNQIYTLRISEISSPEHLRKHLIIEKMESAEISAFFIKK